MRIAVISDIHSNLEALEAVLSDCKSKKADEIICLGDIVGYGANPNECIERVRETCSFSVLGNHDAASVDLLATDNFNLYAKIAIDWTVENLSPDSRVFLRALPLAKQKHSQSFVHATPCGPGEWNYLMTLEDAVFNFPFFETDFCFIGHTHVPLIFRLENEKMASIHEEQDLHYTDMINSRFLINVGSVGQPRDHNPFPCYGLLNTQARTFSFCRVPYDIVKTQNKMRKIRMPDFLITRLKNGR